LPESIGLAFKAYEIEELADVYFFRPLGMVCARAARALGFTPTALTIVGGVIGIIGGSMLYWENLGLAAFAVLIVHSILDSADGQLARMTGQITEVGRLLDGVSGYLTNSAIYLAIAFLMMKQGSSAATVFALLAVAAVSSVFHAQMYDYHRSCYARAVVKRAAEAPINQGIVPWYEAMQRALAGLHPRVESALAARARDGGVSNEDRDRYRACFYWPVRGWNVLGDNTRFYAVGALAWLHHLDWFFPFVIGPMNVAFVVLWLLELRADRRFLAGLW
jgi:phosphatidylglycerophosphate synthase